MPVSSTYTSENSEGQYSETLVRKSTYTVLRWATRALIDDLDGRPWIEMCILVSDR